MNAEQIRQWRADAIADGWEHEAISQGEPEDIATRLKRERWRAQVYLRKPKRKGFNTHSLWVWGPDTLAVEVPETYDWEVLQRRLLWCSRCGDVAKTIRLGFAGRVCPSCREKYKAKVEYPGWTN